MVVALIDYVTRFSILCHLAKIGIATSTLPPAKQVGFQGELKSQVAIDKKGVFNNLNLTLIPQRFKQVRMFVAHEQPKANNYGCYLKKSLV